MSRSVKEKIDLSADIIKNKSNKINTCNQKKSFFLWLSASNPEILANCPKSEITRQEAIGATVLIPSLFSILASSYILFTVEASIFLKIIIPPIWFFVILTLDRALLATYQAKIVQIIFRILMAILIATTISHPVTLTIFHKAIETKANIEIKTPKIDNAKNQQNLFRISVNKIISNLKDEEKNIKSEMIDCNSDPNYRAKYSEETIAYKTQRQEVNQQLIEITRQISLYERKATDEIHGRGESGRPPGKGRIYYSFMNKIHTLSSLVPIKQNRLKELDKRITTSMFEYQKNKTEYQKRKATECEKIQASVLKRSQTIQSLLNKSFRDLASSENELNKTISKIKHAPSGILEKTLLLNKIFKDKKNGGSFAFIVFLSFILLFILVDTIPILLKVFSKGCYEYQLQFEDVELEQRFKQYPKVISESLQEQLEFEVNLRNRKKILNATSLEMCHKNKMIYDFLDMRKKYFNYLSEYFDIDKEKVDEIINIDNADVAKLIKSDNEKVINAFFLSRGNNT